MEDFLLTNQKLTNQKFSVQIFSLAFFVEPEMNTCEDFFNLVKNKKISLRMT